MVWSRQLNRGFSVTEWRSETRTEGCRGSCLCPADPGLNGPGAEHCLVFSGWNELREAAALSIVCGLALVAWFPWIGFWSSMTIVLMGHLPCLRRLGSLSGEGGLQEASLDFGDVPPLKSQRRSRPFGGLHLFPSPPLVFYSPQSTCSLFPDLPLGL